MTPSGCFLFLPRLDVALPEDIGVSLGRGLLGAGLLVLGATDPLFPFELALFGIYCLINRIEGLPALPSVTGLSTVGTVTVCSSRGKGNADPLGTGGT